jgi:hypothetical protein
VRQVLFDHVIKAARIVDDALRRIRAPGRKYRLPHSDLANLIEQC